MDALKRYSQFVLVKAIPRPSGKADKIPVNAEGQPVNPLDARNWLSHADAARIAAERGLLVGFTLTEVDPFFCIDIDSCLLPSNQWSPLACELTHSFPGAMVEVSQSGRGLHIWGSSNHIPPHRCKNVVFNLELYHEKRFILLGGQQAGDANVDCSANLIDVVRKWFPPDKATLLQPGGQVEWTSSPVAEWAGPEDDGELIERACRNDSIAALLGGTVAFRPLWEADTDILAAAWPAAGRPYDASSADAALAQRLAFWTGKNCERMLRLMHASALYRDKYEREDYLRRTILGACSRQTVVYNSPALIARDNITVAGGWVTQADLPKVFAGCVYVRTGNSVYVPGEDGGIMNKDQFNVVFGGKRYLMDERKETDDAFKAFTRAMYWSCPKVQFTTFRPDLPPGEIFKEEGQTYVNTWEPVLIESARGDVAPLLDYLTRVLPNDKDREILTCYLAAVVQHPGVKFSWAPVLQGTEGNGKTMISYLVAKAVGKRYSHKVNAQDLGGNGGKFNAWIQSKVFISIEEIYAQNKREIIEILKPLLTDEDIEVQGKGSNQITGRNIANFILSTNYKDAIPLTRDSRRYGVFYLAQQSADDLIAHGMDNAYFSDLWDWIEGRDKYKGQVPGWKMFNRYLQTYPIPNELNPARGLRRAPSTSSTVEAISASMGSVEQEVTEMIEREAPGFAGGWISSLMLENLLERKRMSLKIPLNKRREMLEILGYMPHPGLAGGRVGSVVLPDGGRPILYVRNGHLSLNVTDKRQIAEMYTKAQQVEVTGGGLVART